tara:strand:+ start:22 stop:228 length:207 start_codon:yes stop_codon:yes gene_type:complete
VWELLNTVSLLKSELIKEIIKPRKLIITKNNCKNVKNIIFASKSKEFLIFFIEKKIIKADVQSPKIKE